MAEIVNLAIRPREVNRSVDKRSDTVYALVMKDEHDRSPLDLTGYTAKMELRRYHESSKVLDTLTTENGRLVIDHERVYVRFPSSVTADYSFDVAVYDLVVLSPSGDRYRIAEGEVVFNPEVTL